MSLSSPSAPLPSTVGAPALEAVDLVRDFGTVRAVNGISFSLRPGEMLAVFGPNGSGKTSLLRMLSGVLRPSSGTVRIHGAGGGSAAGRGRVGVLSHQTFLYGSLTPAENLHLYGRLYGLEDLVERVPARLEAVGLSGRGDDRVKTLSRGMKQRLALARALLHDPDIVLLDEPWTGLDVHAAGVLRDVLGSLRDGRRTVVLVTHNLSQGLELADRVAIQVRGGFAFLERRAMVATPFEAFYREVVEASA
ncbi:MAG: ABC transporter ATP-binding protein [Gemmatimonadota bacterium]